LALFSFFYLFDLLALFFFPLNSGAAFGELKSQFFAANLLSANTDLEIVLRATWNIRRAHFEYDVTRALMTSIKSAILEIRNDHAKCASFIANDETKRFYHQDCALAISKAEAMGKFGPDESAWDLDDQA
jgi:hypothetical protein